MNHEKYDDNFTRRIKETSRRIDYLNSICDVTKRTVIIMQSSVAEWEDQKICFGKSATGPSSTTAKLINVFESVGRC